MYFYKVCGQRGKKYFFVVLACYMNSVKGVSKWINSFEYRKPKVKVLRIVRLSQAEFCRSLLRAEKVQADSWFSARLK